MTTTATKRRCMGKTCITILSRYNDDPDGLCGPCRKATNDRAIQDLREAMEKGVPLPTGIPETRAGSQMWRVLRAMPATAREIAAKTGIPLAKVRVTARDAVADGRAERRKIKRVGSNGEVSEYVCLVGLPEPTGAAGNKKYTRASLIETLHDMRRFLGRVPTATDCGSPWPSRSSFDRHFKTWAEALEQAGMRERLKPREEYLSVLRKGPTTSTEIAKRYDRSVNAVTSTLYDLYEAGLVNREWQPKGRCYLYSLNEQGGA